MKHKKVRVNCIILWLSYGYVMVILWCGDLFGTRIVLFCHFRGNEYSKQQKMQKNIRKLRKNGRKICIYQKLSLILQPQKCKKSTNNTLFIH